MVLCILVDLLVSFCTEGFDHFFLGIKVEFFPSFILIMFGCMSLFMDVVIGFSNWCIFISKYCIHVLFFRLNIQHYVCLSIYCCLIVAGVCHCCLGMISSHESYNSCSDLSEISQRMFFDSEIAAKFSLVKQRVNTLFYIV